MVTLKFQPSIFHPAWTMWQYIAEVTILGNSFPPAALQVVWKRITTFDGRITIATDDWWRFYNPGNFGDTVEQLSTTRSIDAAREINEYEVFLLLSGIKRTSPGADMIPYWVFKHCAIELSTIVDLFNVSIQMGKMPSRWKQAIVTTVPKVRQFAKFTGLSDLRPISVTPILSRVLEKLIVGTYLWSALEMVAGLINDQFTYRPTGSITSLLIKMLHSIYQASSS